MADFQKILYPVTVAGNIFIADDKFVTLVYKLIVMKTTLIGLLVTAITLSACSKSGDMGQNNGTTINNSEAAQKPVAGFTIGNAVNNVVGEARTLEISNTSANGYLYYWDFGNGTTSTEQTPSFFYPIHGNYTITLKVTGYNGRTSTITKDLTVFCGRTTTNHAPATSPIL